MIAHGTLPDPVRAALSACSRHRRGAASATGVKPAAAETRGSATGKAAQFQAACRSTLAAYLKPRGPRAGAASVSPSAKPRTWGRCAPAARNTSPIRSRWPLFALPGSSTSRPCWLRFCMTWSRIPASPRNAYRGALWGAPWPSWWMACPSSTRSSFRARRTPRRRISAKCCWRWRATSASCWSSLPTACTTCARCRR